MNKKIFKIVGESDVLYRFIFLCILCTCSTFINSYLLVEYLMSERKNNLKLQIVFPIFDHIKEPLVDSR